MGINVFLQSLDGRKEGTAFDKHNSLMKLWPLGNKSFPLLQYINPYGNVIFNGLQMDQVTTELDMLMSTASEDQRKVLAEIRALAETCKKHAHLFLRFRGD